MLQCVFSLAILLHGPVVKKDKQSLSNIVRARTINLAESSIAVAEIKEKLKQIISYCADQTCRKRIMRAITRGLSASASLSPR